MTLTVSGYEFYFSHLYYTTNNRLCLQIALYVIMLHIGDTGGRAMMKFKIIIGILFLGLIVYLFLALPRQVSLEMKGIAFSQADPAYTKVVSINRRPDQQSILWRPRIHGENLLRGDRPGRRIL
jgi:hypothetical protein